jgi:hypothetical protein
MSARRALRPAGGVGETAPTPDPELLRQLALGELGALGGLYDRYHEVVRRFLTRATGDAEDVDDLPRRFAPILMPASAITMGGTADHDGRNLHEEQTFEEAEAELRAAGVDVGGFVGRLSARLKAQAEEERLAWLRAATVRRERGLEVGPGAPPGPAFARHQGSGDGDDQDEPRPGHQAPGLRDVGPTLARRQAAHHAGHGAQRAPLPLRGGRLPSQLGAREAVPRDRQSDGAHEADLAQGHATLLQDAMREAQVANVVVRSISGHLTEQMQQRYSTARGHEQESAIARIIDLTRVQQRVRDGSGSEVDSKVDSAGGQHKGTG